MRREREGKGGSLRTKGSEKPKGNEGTQVVLLHADAVATEVFIPMQYGGSPNEINKQYVSSYEPRPVLIMHVSENMNRSTQANLT